ncbi:uncharacterized protein B0T15DRAFT_558538 [Chaetomium strumarium]|uniref:Uncharacterized protein n=1 Tax=Chaetomium strumarium TaxID=1170767 RepID=A0AAJ0GR58_9PEZI|nr:hypothetical protein B0T15DRAFT_558538 [Chaetomium strumarium]
MEHDPRQSIHEICLAREMAVRPGKPMLVTVRSASALVPRSRPIGEDAVADHQSENVPGVVPRGHNVSGRTVSGPRVLFMLETDAWSTFPNPGCSHERWCGHMPRPRILFRPDGEEPVGGANDLLRGLSRSGTGLPTLPLPQIQTAPEHCIVTATLNLLRADMAENTMDDPFHQSPSELPSELGPFLLRAISSGGSFVPAELEYRLPAEQHRSTLRTVDWIMNLPEAATTAPGHAPPLAAMESNHAGNRVVMGNSDREHHYQMPGESAIRGNFIPLSTSFQARSPSPRRKQGSHVLQLSLTDSQMDKLTAALSSEGDDEPFARGRPRDTAQNNEPVRNIEQNTGGSMRATTTTRSRTRSLSPVKSGLIKTPVTQSIRQGIAYGNASRSPGKAQEVRFADRTTPAANGTPSRSGKRAVRGPPPPIDTDIARYYAKQEAAFDRPIIVHRPPERDASPVRDDPNQRNPFERSSSVYSQDSTKERHPTRISPLRIHKHYEPKHVSILQDYAQKADKGSAGLDINGTADESSSGAEQSYTPLAPFLAQGPTIRKASKTMIGEGGWLENTSRPAPTGSPNRAGGFLGNMIKKAKEMASKEPPLPQSLTQNTYTVQTTNTFPQISEAGSDNRAQRKSRESDKDRDKGRPASRGLAISLSPREQSLLYCELEFVLATALNDYITAQFNAGRLEADRLKKVAEDWQRKGRPKVVGFRYDLETQLDLVRMHVHDFKFYSRVAATTALLGIIDTMKANARVLRIRTFCQPDTVVAKQLLDSQSLFNILGCPEDQQIKLAEIFAFFKAAIERERLLAKQEQEQEHQGHDHGHGQETTAGTSTAATAPSTMRNSRSPKHQGGGETSDWWATTATTQIHRSDPHAAGIGGMDPAQYDQQNE